MSNAGVSRVRRVALWGLMGVVALAGLGSAAIWAAGRDPGLADLACKMGSAPAGARSLALRSADGLCLQAYHWQPAQAPRGAVLLVHGLQDHALRHQQLASDLRAQGLAVLAFDLRGHGRSGGLPQRVDSMAQALGDVEQAAAALRQQHPGQPLFIYGHSFGGLLAAHQAARQPQGWQGLVLSSAALQRPADVKPAAEKVLGWLSGWAPNLGIEPLRPERLLRQAEAQAVLRADPLVRADKLPVRTVATLLAGVRDLQATQAALPQLVLHGEADAVTPPAGSRAWAERHAGARLKLYPLALHDLEHEPEGAQARAAIAGFIRAQLPG